MHVNETSARAIPHKSYENVTRLLAPTEVNVAANMITGWGKVMDAIERVANVLIGSRGNSYCDACLASNLTLQIGKRLSRSSPRLPVPRRFSGALVAVRSEAVSGS